MRVVYASYLTTAWVLRVFSIRNFWAAVLLHHVASINIAMVLLRSFGKSKNHICKITSGEPDVQTCWSVVQHEAWGAGDSPAGGIATCHWSQ